MEYSKNFIQQSGGSGEVNVKCKIQNAKLQFKMSKLKQ